MKIVNIIKTMDSNSFNAMIKLLVEVDVSVELLQDINDVNVENEVSRLLGTELVQLIKGYDYGK